MMIGRCGALLLIFSLFSSAYACDPVGQVVFAKGDVREVIDNTSRILHTGDTICNHSQLETKAQGFAQFKFSDNYRLTLEPSSVYQIKDYHYTPEKTGRNIARLLWGKIEAISGDISKANPEHYQLETSLGTIGTRGTYFQVNQVAKGKVTISVLDGIVMFWPLGNSPQMILAGAALTVTRTSDQAVVMRGSFLIDRVEDHASSSESLSNAMMLHRQLRRRVVHGRNAGHQLAGLD